MTSCIDNIPTTERLDYFLSQVSDTFFPMSFASRQDAGSLFEGDLVSHQLGDVGFAAIKSSPLDAYRRRSHISQVSDAAYLIKIQVHGEAVVQQCGREAHLRPGDFTVCLSSEPYELHFPSDYAQMVLSIPQNLMDECVHQPTQHLGVLMDSRVGANGLFTQFVSSIGSRMDTMDSLLAKRLEANVIDLLSTTLGYAQNAQRRDQIDIGVKHEHIQRIKHFIRRHLDDERLTPDWIAAAHEISTRYLHMLFETQSVSISRYILGMRLEACKSALSDAAYAGYSVSNIAYQLGFKDASHFSRSFKTEYGCTPARYRKECNYASPTD